MHLPGPAPRPPSGGVYVNQKYRVPRSNFGIFLSMFTPLNVFLRNPGDGRRDVWGWRRKASLDRASREDLRHMRFQMALRSRLGGGGYLTFRESTDGDL